MSTATVEEVQSHLPELLDKVAAGDQIVIYRDGKPVACLTTDLPKGVPIPGRGKGKLTIVSDDDEHLRDFAEYM
jgi:antitoxin (DNA-binding transcriptional repressor) of toxin-antitoxin stability system